RIVTQAQGVAVGVAQAGHERSGVAGGDAVAIAVLEVIEKAVGPERQDGAVGLPQLVGTAWPGKDGRVAGLAAVASVRLQEKGALTPSHVENDITLGIAGCRHLPRVCPTAAQDPKLVAAGQGLEKGPVQLKRQPGRRKEHVTAIAQRGDWGDSSGL